METREVCARDKTALPAHLPDVVVKPRQVAEISAILRLCTAEHVPVTVRGGGSGLAGGAVPVCGGLVLSMEYFDKILHIDRDNLQITTEPAVITEILQNAVQAEGLYFPPDPSSKGWSHVGGNVATNAGGPRAVKYGVVRDYVLNLEVVLPTGEILWTGANTLKNATGYNLTQLLTGSEGTLAVITKVVLKLLPYPTQRLLLLAPFPSALQACAAVSAIFRAGIVPSTLEFMERSALLRTVEYLGGESPVPILPEDAAHLLIEVDGQHTDTLYAECATLSEVLEQFEAREVLFADNDAQQNALWQIRRSMSSAIKQGGVFHSEDTVVPRAALPMLLEKVKILEQTYGFQTYCYGHAGDGNLHVNIVPGQMERAVWEKQLHSAIYQLFEEVHALGGTISGEHGIGYLQRPYLDIVFTEKARDLRRHIKELFDPAGILNPEKVL